jgi:transcriptional regulator with XRE-family HTH domain
MPETVFSKNLKKARNLKGWSQEGAAQAIREAGAEWFNRPVLGSYEEGRAEPSNETLTIICKAYGIEDMRGFIIDADFFESKTSPEELYRRYISLSGSQKKAVEVLLGIVC